MLLLLSRYPAALRIFCLLLLIGATSDCNHRIYSLHVLLGILSIGMTLLSLALIVRLLLLVLASLLEDNVTLSG